MELSKTEADLIRQWFNSVEDTNPAFLERKDYALAKKLYDAVGLRVPNRMIQRLVE